MGKIKPKYDFYENNMFLDDPLQADLSRKDKCKAPKIGTEPRVILEKKSDIFIDAIECPRDDTWTSILAKDKT
jgi:hypothetical protein